MTSLKLNWTAAAVMAALAGSIPAVQAQDANTPGIVRITDGKPRGAVQPAAFHGHHRANAYAMGGDCPAEDAYCDHCQAGHGCNLFRETYCKNSPDHGYSPPAKYPLHRRGVQYNAYFPNQWYGLPGSGVGGSYPMVYQPTDTTQLGFYYQHVRSWQPNPNMLPQRPVPAQWHIHAPAANGSNFHGGGWGGSGGNPYCQNCPTNQTYPVPQTMPVQPQAPVEAAPVQPVPNPAPAPPAAALPPSPREIQNSADSEHIRRAAY